MTRSAKSSTGEAARTEFLVEVDGAYCKGCGLCIAFCPRGVLELSPSPDSRGMRIARVVEPAACHGCCQCAVVCPEAGIRICRS